MQRNAAINSLRGFGTFRHASLRLLDDLLETVGEHHLSPQEIEAYVACAKEASFSLYWSLDLTYWSDEFKDGPRGHAICLCSSAGQAVPLEALGHVLGYSIAAQFDEPVVVVNVGNEKRMCLWHPKGFSGPKALPMAMDTGSIIAEFPEVPPHPFYHVIFVHPRPSEALAQAQRFHRIVYVNRDAEIAAVPAHLRGLLIDAVWGGDAARVSPRFSSFISTHFLGGERFERSASPCEVGPRLRALLQPGGLRTQPTGDSLEADKRPAAWRLRRDLCRLSIDLGTVARSWREWSTGGWGQQPFAEVLFDENPAYAESAFHWARAVTNRQVGVALSGGGASSYRMVPLLRRLERELAVPVDVVGGVSGGALLGAYYCARGLDGLEQMVEAGPAFTAFAVGAIVSSRSIRLKVDFDLDAARVERLERRFVPLTTMMTSGHPPEQRAVIGGTVGEAVRVSGSAPVLWGQTIQGRRHYADGATAMLIPARSLREHGADMVIACNCVPGPSDGNPLAYYLRTYAFVPPWLAERLTEYTPLGRISDGVVAAAFLNQQASREMEEDAHVYIEPSPTQLSMVESFAFFDARRFVGASAREMARDAGPGRGLLKAARMWGRFRTSPRARR